MNPLLTRRRILLAAAAAGTASLSACVTRPRPTDMPPNVFVHGNGDTAGLWIATIWRFESNGWPRERPTNATLVAPVAASTFFTSAARWVVNSAIELRPGCSFASSSRASG